MVVHGDSQLIIGQVNRMCKAKEKRMKRYLSKVKQCIKGFITAKFHPREGNMEADNLARAASTDDLINDQIKVQYILSIDIPEVQKIDREANWTT